MRSLLSRLCAALQGGALLLLAGCGQQYWSNGVRPTPRGEPRVLLVGRAGAWVPVACYDPLWVRLAGPADCADLIPSGTQAVDSLGKSRLLTHRRPAVCPGTLAVGFPDAEAAGLAVWPAVAPPTWSAVDLDADGHGERIEVAPEGVRVWQGAKIIGACLEVR